MPLADDGCPPSSFLPVSQLIQFLSRMMSMAEITWSSVRIPAVMASSGSNLWVNSLPPRETLPWLAVGRTILVSAFLVVCGRALLYYTWSQAESRNSSDVFSVSSLCLSSLASVCKQDGLWKVMLRFPGGSSKTPARDFQGFGRACDPSWFCMGMGLSTLFQAHLLWIGPAQFNA